MTSFATYFSEVLERERRACRAFSYRALCRRAGIRSPAEISWYASGKRIPSLLALEKLARALRWSGDELEHARALTIDDRVARARDKLVAAARGGAVESYRRASRGGAGARQ